MFRIQIWKFMVFVLKNFEGAFGGDMSFSFDWDDGGLFVEYFSGFGLHFFMFFVFVFGFVW